MSTQDEERKAFAEQMAPKSTDELLAMIAAASAKDKEREAQFKQRREETQKEKIQEKLALCRSDSDDIEDEPAPTWNPEADKPTAPVKEPEPSPLDLFKQQQQAKPAATATSSVAAPIAMDTPPSPVKVAPTTISAVNTPAKQDPSPQSSTFGAMQQPPSSNVPTSTSTFSDKQAPPMMTRPSEMSAMERARFTQLEDTVADLLAENTRIKTQLSGAQETTQNAVEQMRDAQRRCDEAEAAMKEAVDAKDSMEDRINALNTLRAGDPISKDELNDVRNAVAMQDKIVRALELDNARLIEANKDVSKRLRDAEKGIAAAGAKASLAANINEPSPNNTSTTVQPSSIEVERFRTIEAEMKLEIDMLRKEKRQLEAQLGRVDYSKVEAAELEARNAKVTLKRKEATFNEELQDMARKVAWYVEHQEFNRAQEELIKEQQRDIHDLRLKVMQSESLVNKSGVVRNDKDRQIKNLQKRVVELEDALRENNPNSITELIRACRPSLTDQKSYKDLTGRIKELEGKLEEQEDQAQRTIDRLRVQADQVKMQFQERLEKMEAEMRIRMATSQSRKVKDAEKALTDARRYYGDKLKESEQTILALRRGAPVARSSSAANQRTPGSKQRENRDGGYAAPTKSSAAASTNISRDDSPTGDGRTRGSQTTATAASVAKLHKGEYISIDEHNQEVQALNQTIVKLQQELHTAHQAAALSRAALGVGAPAALVSAAIPSLPTGSSDMSAVTTLQAQLNAAYQELAVHKRLLVEAEERQRQTLLQWEERLLKTRSEHQKAMELLHQDNTEELARLSKSHRIELQALMANATQNAETAALLLPPNGDFSKPTAVHQYLQAVSQRLQSLEHQQSTKEAESRRMVEEVKQMAQFELSVEKQKMDLVVQQKNAEIDQFRSQLDSLLNDLSQLRGS